MVYPGLLCANPCQHGADVSAAVLLSFCAAWQLTLSSRIPLIEHSCTFSFSSCKTLFSCKASCSRCCPKSMKHVSSLATPVGSTFHNCPPFSSTFVVPSLSLSSPFLHISSLLQTRRVCLDEDLFLFLPHLSVLFVVFSFQRCHHHGDVAARLGRLCSSVTNVPEVVVFWA